MTRINLVDVAVLTDQHLLAEWREIKMVPAALQRYLKTNTDSTMLKKVGLRYKLGSGHVSFFYDKMQFLSHRYRLLTAELLARNVRIQDLRAFDVYTNGLPDVFKTKIWMPDEKEIAISEARIFAKISEKSNWYKYHKEIKSIEFYRVLLNAKV